MTNIDLTQVISAETKAAHALDAARSSALLDMTAQLDRIAENVTGVVPMAERLSWPIKAAAAEAFLAGEADATQHEILQAEAAQTGETVATLAELIARNTSAYAAISAWLAGLRRRYRDRLRNSGSETEVTAALADFDAEIAAGP
ncbi:hypothetical protein [Roseovarius salinarum]|uniref:hypothetical protein n=1 Tax=Roseovarius salinarum TaxID=1981892 RepID=UPI000C343A52|nr:hypothetical protein [Roseovarius salinarum]